jgi:hypothetical protein
VERKLNLTKQILAKLDKPFAEEIALATWWTNIRDTGGMGLTEHGYNLFTQQLDIKSYEWDIEANSVLGNRIVLALDRKMEFPYYIKRARSKKTKGKLYLFGERDAVLINLCGSLEKFVENTLV